MANDAELMRRIDEGLMDVNEALSRIERLEALHNLLWWWMIAVTLLLLALCGLVLLR